MVQILSAGVRTIILIPLFFVYTMIKAGTVAWIGKRNRKSPKVEQTIQTWARRFLQIPPVEIAVMGAEHVDASRRYVVVSNHISNFDIPVLFRAVPTPIRFLAKKELYKIPLLGPGMDMAGIVKVDRGGARSTREAINTAAAETYRRGFSLLVFAEGTRSRTGEMADFHTGGLHRGREVAAVAIRRAPLRAQDDRDGVPGDREQSGQALPEELRLHVGLVALAAEPAQFAAQPAVSEPLGHQRRFELLPAEVRVMPGGGIGADVDDGRDLERAQARDEFLERPVAVADRVEHGAHLVSEPPLNPAAANAQGRFGHGCSKCRCQ